MNAFGTALDLAFASEIAGLRPADPAATQAAADAQLASIDGHFDGLESLARSIIAKGYKDGIFPDRRSVAREDAA